LWTYCWDYKHMTDTFHTRFYGSRKASDCFNMDKNKSEVLDSMQLYNDILIFAKTEPLFRKK
jgi:hypothetical protein